MAGRRPTRRAGEVDRAPPDAETALEIAAHFLGTRPRTRRELELRLRRAGSSDEVTAATLARLEGMGLVDDVAFTRWWAEQRDRQAPRGRRMVEAELRQRGVPREVIEGLRGEELAEPALAAEAIPGTEAERATTALARHLKGRPLPDDPRALQRLGAFLMRRGFDPETVRITIRAAGQDPVDDS